MSSKGLSLKEKILVAVVEGTDADPETSFTLEDLTVWAWQREQATWGLRGYESIYPDSDKVQKELGSRGRGNKGIVDLGWLDRVGTRIYCLTPAGLANYALLDQSNQDLHDKAGRKLEVEVRRILEHPVFKDWLVDSTKPKHFRAAGHFWGIAPGTPKNIVKQRIGNVDAALHGAIAVLDDKGVDELSSSQGKILFEREDIHRCLEFHREIKARFEKDVRILDPNFKAA